MSLTTTTELNADKLPGFDPRKSARTDGPDTSKAAAHSLNSGVVREAQRTILSLYRTHGLMTNDELIGRYRAVTTAPKQTDQSIRSRRAELTAAGLIIDTGKRVKLPSGRRSIVWAAV